MGIVLLAYKGSFLFEDVILFFKLFAKKKRLHTSSARSRFLFIFIIPLASFFEKLFVYDQKPERFAIFFGL